MIYGSERGEETFPVLPSTVLSQYWRSRLIKTIPISPQGRCVREKVCAYFCRFIHRMKEGLRGVWSRAGSRLPSPEENILTCPAFSTHFRTGERKERGKQQGGGIYYPFLNSLTESTTGQNIHPLVLLYLN